MKYSLTIDINDKTISITSADGSVSSAFSNLVGLDENDKFLIIGRTSEEIQEQSPHEWEKMKDKTHFRNPFSLDYFKPDLAAPVIEYLAYLTIHPTPRSQMSLITDSVELFLRIPEYEKMAEEAKELFEFHLQEILSFKVKFLLINDLAKDLSKIRQSKRMAKLGLPVFGMLVFLLAYIFSSSLLGDWSSPIPEDEKWLFLIVTVLAALFLIFIASFAFVVSWKFATKNLLSDSISRIIMERHKVGLPKPLMDWIWQKIPSDIAYT